MPEPTPDADRRSFLDGLADRYADLQPLTGGGMAELYVGTELRLARRVVIKRVDRRLASEEARDRFRREIVVLATLQHPNIVPLLHADEVDGTPYFVMPFVPGEALRERLQRGPLSVREAVQALDDVAQALETAHASGVVHRDIKPGNILLTRGAAVVADFGIARVLSRSPEGKALSARTPTDPTLEGLSLGTPRYMAPEQFVGDDSVDHRADLYAFGIVAYEMLAGRPPFPGPSLAQIARAHMVERPPSLRAARPDVPERLEALIFKCLEKDPDARPRSASEILRTVRSSEGMTERSGTERSSSGKLPARIRARILDASREFRLALRALARTPVLFSACLFCLALGVGSTAAVFSVVDRALLRPLPFGEPDRLVSVFRSVNGVNGRNSHAPLNMLDLREDPTLDQLEWVASASRLIDIGDRREPAAAMRVTGTAFHTLRVDPALGRLLTDADDGTGAPSVVVLSHEFWRDRLGGSPAIIGTPLRLDGVVHEIVGVLPPAFRIPDGAQMLSAEIWLPMRLTEGERAVRTNNYLRSFARLAPGRSLTEAQSAIDARFAGIVERVADLKNTRVLLLPMSEEARAGVRAPLLLLFVAALVVLAIAVINVSSLLLARGIRREPELALRSSLGATRAQVMRPVFAESVVIAVAGTALGLGLATVAVRTIGWLAAQRVPQLDGATVDVRVAAVAFALALVASTLGAVAPALRAARAEPAVALRGGSGSGRKGHHRALAALVVAEGALALALLIGAGLVLKGFVRLTRHDPGFDVASALAMRVRVSPGDYADGRAATAFLEPAIEAVRAVPGVTAVGAISQLPYAEWGWNAWVAYDGMPEMPMTERPLVETRNVHPGFFAATGQRLIVGRLLDARDQVDAPPLKVVVNQALVQRDFPNRDPIGRFLTIGGEASEIVGVVSDIRNFGPFDAPRPEATWAFAQRNASASSYWLLIRSASGDPAELAGPVERALRAVNPRAAVSDVSPMSEVLAQSLGRPRFLFSLFGALALVALLLALSGLFGMLTYAVEQQRRELGVRSALGASPARLARDVLRQAGILVACSAGIGLGLGWVLTRMMGSVLYGVEPNDPTIWLLAIAALSIAGLAATLGPARRAGRTPPMVSIRGA